MTIGKGMLLCGIRLYIERDVEWEEIEENRIFGKVQKAKMPIY